MEKIIIIIAVGAMLGAPIAFIKELIKTGRSIHPGPGALVLFAAGLFCIMNLALLSMIWPKLSLLEFVSMLMGMFLGYEAWRYTFSR